MRIVERNKQLHVEVTIQKLLNTDTKGILLMKLLNSQFLSTESNVEIELNQVKFL